jgi:membrane protein
MRRFRSAASVVVRATINFDLDGCFDRASLIAYFALLSLIPLVVLLTTVGALVLGAEQAEHGTALFLQKLFRELPPRLMAQVLVLSTEKWFGLGYLLLAVWTASKVFSKIESGLDVVFGVDKPRDYAARKIYSFALVGLLSVLLVAVTLFGGLMSAIDRFIDTTALAPLKDLPLYDTLNGFVSRYVFPWGLTIASFALVYRMIPRFSVPWRTALVGGVVAGTLWEVCKVAFTYYVSHLANYTRTYGALSTIFIFLFWMNISASILLWGGELAAVVGGFRSDEKP